MEALTLRFRGGARPGGERHPEPDDGARVARPDLHRRAQQPHGPQPEPASRRGARGTRRQEPVPGAGRPPALVGHLADEGASGGVRLRPHAQDDGRLAVPHRVGDDLGDRDEEALHRVLGERGAAGVVGDVGPQPVQVGLVELQRVGVGRRRGQRLPVALRAVGPRVHEAGVGDGAAAAHGLRVGLAGGRDHARRERRRVRAHEGRRPSRGTRRWPRPRSAATRRSPAGAGSSTPVRRGRAAGARPPRRRRRRSRQSASVRAGWVYQVRGSRDRPRRRPGRAASRSSISCPVPQTATTRSPAAIPSAGRGGRRRGTCPRRRTAADGARRRSRCSAANCDHGVTDRADGWNATSPGRPRRPCRERFAKSASVAAAPLSATTATACPLPVAPRGAGRGRPSGGAGLGAEAGTGRPAARGRACGLIHRGASTRRVPRRERAAGVLWRVPGAGGAAKPNGASRRGRRRAWRDQADAAGLGPVGGDTVGVRVPPPAPPRDADVATTGPSGPVPPVSGPRRSDAEVAAETLHVAGGPHVVVRLLDPAFGVDEEGGADHAHDDLAVQLLLAIGAVGLQDLGVRVGQQREGQAPSRGTSRAWRACPGRSRSTATPRPPARRGCSGSRPTAWCSPASSRPGRSRGSRACRAARPATPATCPRREARNRGRRRPAAAARTPVRAFRSMLPPTVPAPGGRRAFRGETCRDCSNQASLVMLSPQR